MRAHISRRLFFAAVSVVSLLGHEMFGQQKVPDKKVILMLGPPGSGKSTQADNLKRKYRIPSYSMASILGKETGWVKDQYKKSLGLPMATGDIIGDELANQLVEKYITQKEARNGFILDGYPRTIKQAEYLDATLGRLGLPRPVVIHLTVPDAVAVQRMRDRNQKQDKPEMIEQRMADYHAEAKFLTGHYGDRLRAVDGTPSKDKVWLQVDAAMREFGP
jgi:adenylate kinase